MTQPLTQEALRAALHYDHQTGVFSHTRSGSGVHVGMAAGRIDSWGYRQIRVNNRRYAAHRLAFLWMTGEWPKQVVDHINGDKDDNRWTNLRDVSQGVNCQNIRAPNRKNTTGFLGVSMEPSGRFSARVYLNRKPIYLGTFDTAEEAHQEYVKAKRIHHEGCTL